MADNVAKEAPLGAKHAKTPLYLGHHVGDRFERQLGRGGQAVFEVLVALAQHLKIHRDDRGRTFGGFGAVKQALHEVIVFECVDL